MTAAPVVTITDAVVAELELDLEISLEHDDSEEGEKTWKVHPTLLRELLKERASLLADARRIDWLERQFKTCTVYMDGQHPWSPNSYKLRELRGPTFRIAIDQAM